jgi:hypothetical protein
MFPISMAVVLSQEGYAAACIRIDKPRLTSVKRKTEHAHAVEPMSAPSVLKGLFLGC